MLAIISLPAKKEFIEKYKISITSLSVPVLDLSVCFGVRGGFGLDAARWLSHPDVIYAKTFHCCSATGCCCCDFEEVSVIN